MTFFNTSKSLVENLDSLSGPVIAILGIVGILQLKMTKRAIFISSKREAASLSANQIEIYNNQIIPLQNILFNQEVKEKIERVDMIIGEFHIEAIKEKLGEKKTRKHVIERLQLVSPILSVINAMEAFSTYFVKGVADEEIAYSSVGRTFCESVEDYYFDIATCIDKGEENRFQNIIELYKIWSARLKKEKLAKDKEAIIKKMNEIKDDKVNPIGTF